MHDFSLSIKSSTSLATIFAIKAVLAAEA